MKFFRDDHRMLSETLDAFAVPMFAAERIAPDARFRLICVNTAHTARTGLQSTEVRGKSTFDLLPQADAEAVQGRYENCARLRQPTTYEEHLTLKGVITHWNTTLQPVYLADGTERIIGTALMIPAHPVRERLVDAAYFSAKAQMHVGKVRHFLDIMQFRQDVPYDLRNMAEMVGNLTNSLDTVLGDIRGLSRPPQDMVEPIPIKQAFGTETVERELR